MTKKKIESVDELPIMPLTIEDMTWNRTGYWRLLTPAAADKLPPCRSSCPIGQPIPEFIQAALQGDWDNALSRLMAYNPLPGVTGRLCYHPCQARCIRSRMDRAVQIKELERAASERGVPRLGVKGASGSGVAVLGAGPAGLSAAFHLALQGCRVTVMDPTDRAGGFLRNAPSERLPGEVLDREMERLAAVSGIKLRTGVKNSEGGRYELFLLDCTAYPSGGPEEAALRDLAAGGVECLEIRVAGAPAPFKASQAAHAVGLGLKAALEAQRRLKRMEPDRNGAHRPGPVLDPDAVKLERMPDEKTARLQAEAVGKPDESLRMEAGRCLSCGTCNLCQSCVLACPDACCLFDEQRQCIAIDLYHCKGCGICAFECPRGVLTMEDLP